MRFPWTCGSVVTTRGSRPRVGLCGARAARRGHERLAPVALSTRFRARAVTEARVTLPESR